jgi:diguanylate cyclase (GGDEF)-like protein
VKSLTLITAARQQTAGEIGHVCVVLAVVVYTSLALGGASLGLWFPLVAALFALACLFPLQLVLFRAQVCGANVGDVALLAALAVGARGSALPALGVGLAIATVIQIRRGEWPLREAPTIYALIMMQMAITAAMVELFSSGRGLSVSTWIPLGLSYVVRIFSGPLASLAFRAANRSISAFVSYLKGAATVAIFVDGMTACVFLVAATLVEHLLIALIPAGFVAIGMMLSARSRKEVAETAETDELTGALNRRGFTNEFSRQFPTSKSGFVLLMDADRLKMINDEYGHLAGDSVLRHIVTQSRSVLPAGALLARLGGDEFAVAIFGVEPQANIICALTDSIAQPVQDLPGVRCSVSIGAARFAESDQLSEIMHRADLEMYTNKQLARQTSEIPASIPHDLSNAGEHRAPVVRHELAQLGELR